MNSLGSIIKDDYIKWKDEDYIFEKIDGKYREVKYKDFFENSLKIAKYLINGGFKDKYIMIFGDNSIRLAEIDLACMAYVGKSTVVSKEWKKDDLLYGISKLNASICIYDDSKKQIIEEIKDLVNIPLVNMNDLDFSNIPFDDDLFNLSENPYEECCKIVFSSGTTGKPKAVMLSQKNIMAGYNSLIRRCPFNHEDVTYLFLPLNHTYANIYNFVYSLIAGYRIYLASSTLEIANELLETNPTIFCAVPKVIERLLDGYKDNIDKAFGKNIKYIFCGGAELSPKIRKIFKDKNLNMMQAYALSETASSFAIDYPFDDDLYSTGTIFEDIDAKIFEPNEKGEGEIIVKGDNVFLGYAFDEELTKKVFDEDGYFHTGDLGYIKDNKLYLVGRKKRLILTHNGENVSPDELEELLKKNELIKNAVVFQKDNLICANLYVDDFEFDYNSYVNELNENLPKFERIDKIEVLKNNIDNKLK